MKHKYTLAPPPDFFEACSVPESDFKIDYAQSSLLWNLMRLIYEQNYPKQPSKNPIPKILHFIWLGSDIPERYVVNINDWTKKNPNFEIQIWTDEDASSFDMKNRELFDKTTNLGMKSDILRYEILYQHGGVYLDTDMFCLQPLDELNTMFEFYAGLHFERDPIIGNAVIASVPKHEVMRYCIEDLMLEPNSKIKRFTKDEQIMFLTGPMYFSSKIMRYIGNADNGIRDDMVLFPSKFFYPLPMDTSENVESYLEPYSKAIHMWHASWQTGE